jgi:hypothetical protein
MRIALALFLFAHGLAHIVGFLGAWAPTRTTIIGDRIDLGAGWIKLVGVCWLLGAVLFAIAGFAVLMNATWWPTVTVSLAAASLVLCLLQLPETKFGVALNVALLAVLLIGRNAAWF